MSIWCAVCYAPLFAFAALWFSVASLSASETDGVAPLRDPELVVLFDRLRQEQLAAVRDRDLVSADRYIELQRSDGWFEDIPTEDERLAEWAPADAMSRLRTLVFAAHHPDADDAAAARYREASLRLLDAWLDIRPMAPNWWFNQIRVPRDAARIYPLAEPWLTAEQRRGLLEVINQTRLLGGDRSMMSWATGANLVWSANNELRRGVFENDPDLVAEAARLIIGEIIITDEEGMQVDGSFHQHSARLQQFQYGTSMIGTASELAALLHETRFAVPDEQLAYMARTLLDGNRWMVRGGRTVPATKDRAATRPPGASRVRPGAAPTLAKLSPEHREPLLELADYLRHGPGEVGPPILGMRYFWRSDFAAWHRPEASFFVKTVSDRTYHTEKINNENLLGEYFNAGVHYLLVRGDEYDGVFPAWDWQRLPGLTAFADPALRSYPERSPLVGGVSDGSTGAAAFDFIHQHDDARLEARRAWFFGDDLIICLGAGIRATGDTHGSEVLTTLNQTRLRTPVAAGVQGKVQTLERGQHTLASPDWLWHDGIGYQLVEPAPIRLSNDTQHGDWQRINAAASDDPVEVDMFLASIDHGQQPDNATYAYAIRPGVASPEAMAAVEDKWGEVLANRPGLQAVYFAASRQVVAVFYEAGALTLPAGRTIAVDRPVAVMLSDGNASPSAIHVADMQAKAGPLTLTLDDQPHVIDLPAGEWAGQPIVLNTN